jgi:hypothetical protein
MVGGVQCDQQGTVWFYFQSSGLQERETHHCVSLTLEPTNMAQTANLSFFSNLFASKNHDMISYQEALDFPREHLPFSTR